jgi:flagellar hook protein FlgE
MKRRCIMISAINNTISSMKAQEKKMATIANNVANSSTQDFSKTKTEFEPGKGGSLKVNIDVVNNPPPPPPNGDRYTMEITLSSGDLSEDIPEAMITEKAYEANAKVLKTEDEMMGTMLDMIG